MLGPGHGRYSTHEALLLEFVHEHQKTRTLLAKTIGFWDAAVAEVELRRVLAVPAHLLQVLALFKTGSICFHQVQIKGLIRVFHGWVFSCQDQQVAIDAVTYKGLLAVDDHMVSVFRSSGAH